MFEGGFALEMYYCNLGMDTADTPDTSAATAFWLSYASMNSSC
jgi:hypothetical protein